MDNTTACVVSHHIHTNRHHSQLPIVILFPFKTENQNYVGAYSFNFDPGKKLFLKSLNYALTAQLVCLMFNLGNICL